MNNLKKIVVILVVIFFSLEIFVYINKTSVMDNEKIVAVSSFALYDITKYIVGNTVKVVNILPFGVEPHSFEPTPKLMQDIEKSALVFYSGAGLEPWTQGFTFTNRAIDMSKYVKLRELDSDEFESHEHHDEHCSHSNIDPHYWLDFSNMQKMTQLITEELIKLMPEKKNFYLKNRDIYILQLKKLDILYRNTLTQCKLKSVILSHNSIGYLAKNYNFHAESLSGLSPEAQPTANDVKRVFKEIQKDAVQTIFFENFVNNKVIKSIARDANITLDIFQPLGNITADEAKEGLSYSDMMKVNLKKLSKALKCN